MEPYKRRFDVQWRRFLVRANLRQNTLNRAVGGDQLDRGEDRLHGGDVAGLGPAGRA